MNKGAITLLICAVFYCYASGAEVLLVKLMNAKPPHGAGVLLPLGTALLLNGYWPIQLVMYRFVWSKTKSPRPLTWKHVRGYTIIGVMAAAVSGLRCVGINYMPGSVYVVISTADLPLNTMLSRLILKKKFTVLQYVAVLCAMLGILVCLSDSGGENSDSGEPCDDCDIVSDWGPYILVRTARPSGIYHTGVVAAQARVCAQASLLSAFFSACNSVLGEFLLSKDKKNPLLAVCEVSFFNSFIPFCFIGAFLTATQWWKACEDQCNPCGVETCLFETDISGLTVCESLNVDHPECQTPSEWCVGVTDAEPAGTKPHTCYTHLRPWSVIYDYVTNPNPNFGDKPLTTLFCGVAFGLCISKMVDRIAKFYIVALQGAFFFALLDTFRRLATAVVAIWAFGEAFTTAKVIALMLSILAIFLHSFSSHKKNLEKKQLELFQKFVEPPTFEEEQEKLRQRYASVRGLPDTATWDDIEAHDANCRKGKGLSRVSLAQLDSDENPAGAGTGASGDGIGANLLDGSGGDSGTKSDEQGVWDFLGLDFLVEASADVRVMRGVTAEDAEVVAPMGARKCAQPGTGTYASGTLGLIGRMTRSGLTAQEDMDEAFDVAFNNYN